MIKLTTKDGAREILFDNKFYTLNELEIEAADADLSTSKGIKQVGEYLNSTAIGTRDISITGYILAENADQMRSRKRDLIKLVNPLDSFCLVVDKYKLNCNSTDTIKFAVAHYENNDKLAKFVISATAINPCFEYLEETTVKVALWRAAFKFPLILQANKPFIVGAREPSKIATINNDGDIQTGMIVEFVAKREVTNPYLFNLNTREEIKINKTLQAGEIVRVNTNYGTKTVIGEVGTETSNYFKYLDIYSTFMQLQTGRNEFRWGADINENNLEVNVIFSPKYLGV